MKKEPPELVEMFVKWEEKIKGVFPRDVEILKK